MTNVIDLSAYRRSRKAKLNTTPIIAALVVLLVTIALTR